MENVFTAASGDAQHVFDASGTAVEWTFSANDFERADVQQLLAFHFAQMRLQSPADACHVLPLDGLRDPAITFWSLRGPHRLFAVGAVKQLDERHGEVKSMRTAPDALGCGAGTAMLRHILAEARCRGYQRLSLETGSTDPFRPALRLYERHGFTACGPFADYTESPFTRFLTTAL
ncbi:MAG TPA: GNAT family N-acetyltransferase [Allosphingosinicella sp.]|jgi:putative acetyltransferase